jgi:uncharacterized phage protein gp47/JayE
MPNQLTSEGLQIKTVTEIKDSLSTGLQSIYGTDINLSSNSPDGQLLGIFSQVAIDNLELLQQIYNSFSVENAYGTILDQRVALNGLTRRSGTFTFTNVSITTDRALTLAGLDGDVTSVDGTGFTVADDAGNSFVLASTTVISGAGTASYSFRAKAIGLVETTPNTITNQITVTLGVTAVNNPTSATILGVDEETDVALKLRHSQMFSLPSIGPSDSMESALLSIPNVTDALVVENDTTGTVDGIGAHSIWTIVEGGDNADIGAAIYAKKIAGVGQTGATTVTVARPNGSNFTAKFDRPAYLHLYIKFTIIPRVTGATFDPDLVKANLVASLSYRLNQSANIGDVVVAMMNLEPNGVLTDVGVGYDATTYYDTINPVSYKHKFVLDVSRIAVTV